MQDKIKKKLKKKLLISLLPSIPFVFTVILIAVGLVSVMAFFHNIFSFGSEGKSEQEIAVVMQQIQEMSLEEIIAVVDNKKIITEEALDEMMIERSTLKRLLQAVQRYNTTWESVTKQIEVEHRYLVEESESVVRDVPITVNGVTTMVPTTFTNTYYVEQIDYEWMDYEVSTEMFESPYKIDWQVVYITTVIQGIQNSMYENNGMSISTSTNEGTDENQSQNNLSKGDGDENEESNDIIGSTEYVATPFDDIFEAAAAKTGLPVNLLKAVARQESSYNPNAVSCVGAQGLMQLMPATAREYGVTDPFDPYQNVMGGANLLRNLLIRFDGNLVLALAGYNAGPGNVIKYGGVPPFEETQNYVVKVIGYFTGGDASSLQEVVDKYNLPISFLVSFGKFVDGRLTLTDSEIDAIIEDFSADFEYEFDVVRDEQQQYSFSECQSLPNTGMKQTGALDNNGRYIWYEPVSRLTKVKLADRDITFLYDEHNNVVSKRITYRIDRWKSLIYKYWATYDPDFMALLLRELPGGEDIVNSYDVPESIIKQ